MWSIPFYFLFLPSMNNLINASPATNPPIWAKKAIPPCAVYDKEMNPLNICRTIHNPRTTKAGNRTIRNTTGTIASTFAFGNIRMYEPRIPEIAPDAPICGMVDCGFVKICASEAMIPTII